jgi:uncharacterized protein YceK
MKITIIALMTSALLTGCGTIGAQFRAAAEPTTGVMARVRVIATQPVRATPGKKCADLSAPGDGVVVGADIGSSGYVGRSLEMPKGSRETTNSDVAEMYVVAGEPITFSFIRTTGNPYICDTSAISFVPAANADYEVAMNYDKRGACNIVAKSLTDPKASVAQQKVAGCAKPMFAVPDAKTVRAQRSADFEGGGAKAN